MSYKTLQQAVDDWCGDHQLIAATPMDKAGRFQVRVMLNQKDGSIRVVRFFAINTGEDKTWVVSVDYDSGILTEPRARLIGAIKHLVRVHV